MVEYGHAPGENVATVVVIKSCTQHGCQHWLPFALSTVLESRRPIAPSSTAVKRKTYVYATAAIDFYVANTRTS